jgi:4-diphosphocytidyl-2-C-methyl-D-erythritol kinase
MFAIKTCAKLLPRFSFFAKIPALMPRLDSEIVLDARAKVNLSLEILGKRPDGYHDLRSVVMPISLTDTVSLYPAPSGGIGLSVTAEDWIRPDRLGPGAKNLAVRVARLMQERYEVQEGVFIRIHKRIPIGGGMGGGSADAAAVIHGLNRLWNLALSRAELALFGADLGCDIPSLVIGGAVIAEGRGERVRPLLDNPCEKDVAPMWLVVANPGTMCSTARIFGSWRADLTKPPEIIHNIRSHIQEGDVGAVANALYNGLEQTVFSICPEVAATAALLKEAGCLGVLLSGSGASVFGLVVSESHGESVSRALPAGLWHRIVQTCPVV